MDMEQYYTNASTDPLLVFEMPDTGVSFPDLPADPEPARVKGLKDLKIFVDSADKASTTSVVNVAMPHCRGK